jgi:hypothetical protein
MRIDPPDLLYKGEIEALAGKPMVEAVGQMVAGMADAHVKQDFPSEIPGRERSIQKEASIAIVTL